MGRIAEVKYKKQTFYVPEKDLNSFYSDQRFSIDSVSRDDRQKVTGLLARFDGAKVRISITEVLPGTTIFNLKRLRNATQWLNALSGPESTGR